MNRFVALCYLMGRSDAPPSGLRLDEHPTADLVLIYALCCARAGKIGELAGVCPLLDADDRETLSAYVLMLGLSGRVDAAFRLFDLLKRIMPEVPAVWLGLARLQAAWHHLLPAARSEAVYRRLAGRPAVLGLLPPVRTKASGAGAIHRIAGDVRLR